MTEETEIVNLTNNTMRGGEADPTMPLDDHSLGTHGEPREFVIDSREAAAKPITHACLLRSRPLDPVMVETLTFGDYAFFGGHALPGQDHLPTIGVECSTVSDLVGKIDSDRFGYQMTGMIQTYDVPILMILGQMRASADGLVMLPGPNRVSYDRINAALFAAQSHGVIVRFTRSYDQDLVAGELHQMWKYWQTPYDQHKTFREMKVTYSPRPDSGTMPLGVPLDPRIQTLMTLPGVGEVNATAAIRQFPSLFQFFTASEEAKRTIDGWGKKTAAAVHEYIWRGFRV